MNVFPRWTSAVGAIVLGALLAANAAGQSLSDEELQHSQWNGSYEALGGGKVQAKVTFDGDGGHYDISGGRGTLSDVTYKFKLGGGAEIKGSWSLGGTGGTFTFFVAGNSSPPVFSGAWQSGGQSGGWNGRFVQVVSTNAGGVQFGKWKKDPNRDRYFCEYQYPAKDNPTTINVQVMIWYPNDDARSGYYYFVNKNNKIWGRCVCPANPAYNPGVMQWATLDGDTWQDLPAGDCPAPKDGDPQLAAIDKIPDPPA